MGKRLEAMRHNPKADWRIGDVEAVCCEHGIDCDPPTGGGSHYKVAHAAVGRILTIPSRRPLKAIYIKKLIAFIDEVENADDGA